VKSSRFDSDIAQVLYRVSQLRPFFPVSRASSQRGLENTRWVQSALMRIVGSWVCSG
jgi:hypothetical protein